MDNRRFSGRHSRNTSLETKTRMQKAMDDLEKASNDIFEDAKLGIDQINEIILALKKIEEIIDIETNKIVSKRIRLWNSGQPKPNVSWHERWVERNKMRRSPNEGVKLKSEITANLTEAEQYKSQQLAIQDFNNSIIKGRLSVLKHLLDDNNLAEYTFYNKISEHFLDSRYLNEGIKNQRDGLKTIEDYKTRLVTFKRELEQQIQKIITQDTSSEQDTSLSQEKRLRNEFEKLYANYKTRTTKPKEIPEYFECAISQDTIMFPISRIDDKGHFFTYESDDIMRALTVSTKRNENGTYLPPLDPQTNVTVKFADYMSNPIFESLLDEFIIDPEAYYKNYDTTDYKTAQLQEEKGLTKDEVSIYLKNAHLQKDRGLTKNELITLSAGKRKTKQKKQTNKRIPKQTQQKKYTNKRRQKQTNKRRKLTLYKNKNKIYIKHT